MKPQERIDAVARNANPTQKIVVAIIVPIVIVLLGYGIMEVIDDNWSDLWRFSPDELDESWWGWMLVFIVIGLFEWYWLNTRSTLSCRTIADGQSIVTLDNSPTKGASKIVSAYHQDPNGKDTLAIASDAPEALQFRGMLIHVAGKMPASSRAIYAKLANIEPEPWTNRHSIDYADLCLYVLRNEYQNGHNFPSQYNSVGRSLVNMTIEPPFNVSTGLYNYIRGILLE